jgi:hypothetical protein
MKGAGRPVDRPAVSPAFSERARRAKVGQFPRAVGQF